MSYISLLDLPLLLLLSYLCLAILGGFDFGLFISVLYFHLLRVCVFLPRPYILFHIVLILGGSFTLHTWEALRSFLYASGVSRGFRVTRMAFLNLTSP